MDNFGREPEKKITLPLDQMGYLSTYERTILSYPSIKHRMRAWTRFSWLRMQTMTGSCEHGNGYSYSINSSTFLDLLSDFRAWRDPSENHWGHSYVRSQHPYLLLMKRCRLNIRKQGKKTGKFRTAFWMKFCRCVHSRKLQRLRFFSRMLSSVLMTHSLCCFIVWL